MSLSKLAEKHKVEFVDFGNGHIQFKGKLTVNYYPDSKLKTAYINGMIGSVKNVSPEKAVKMANEIPAKNGIKGARKKSYAKDKAKLLKKHPFCCWCKAKLTRETATIEHLIPLGLGGINNANNYALACEPCNSKRGCNMPELSNK